MFRMDRAVIMVNSLLTNAGVERRTLEFAKFLRAKNVEVEVLVLRETGKIVSMFEDAGIPVRHIQVYEYDDARGRHTFYPLPFSRLILHLLARRFGLVFCVQPPAYIFGRAACYPPMGRRVIAMERYLVTGRSPRRLRVDRWMSRWSKVVCVSNFLRDELVAECGIDAGRIAVIENGVTVEPPVDRQEDLRKRIAGRFVFGCVGLLTARKRQAVLIEAFAGLAGPAPKPVLILVGGGEDETTLRKLAASLGVADDVIFTGEQIHVHDFYPLFDCFVFPSVGEGFGTAWAEAMHHGLPVICADVRPMNDYIRQDENGLLTSPDDVESLRAAMRRLMASPELRQQLGARAKAVANEHFQSERQLQKLLDFARS